MKDHGLPSASRAVENTLLASRYLLVPMYLGLIVAMLAYDYAFMAELWHMAKHLFTVEDAKEFLLLGVLQLLDMAMIANLIIMIMIGSQSIFVDEIDQKGSHMPRFLKGLTSGLLKVKMGASLVSVSSVHLLTDFMSIAHVSWDELLKKVILHSMFILAAYVFAVIEVKLHPPHEPATEPVQPAH